MENESDTQGDTQGVTQDVTQGDTQGDDLDKWIEYQVAVYPKITEYKSKRVRDASIYASKKISLKFLFLSDIFLFPPIRQQVPILA